MEAEETFGHDAQSQHRGKLAVGLGTVAELDNHSGQGAGVELR